MKMHCELLGGKFYEESTTASVVDFIKSMADGGAAHRAGALKLALRNGSNLWGVDIGRPVSCEQGGNDSEEEGSDSSSSSD